MLLLDEPTSNLDPYNVRLIEDLLAQQRAARNTTIILITHNVDQLTFDNASHCPDHTDAIVLFKMIFPLFALCYSRRVFQEFCPNIICMTGETTNPGLNQTK